VLSTQTNKGRENKLKSERARSSSVAVFIGTCRVATEDEFSDVHPLAAGYRPNLVLASEYLPCQLTVEGEGLATGQSGEIEVRAIVSEKSAPVLKPGVEFELREGPHTIAWCQVTAVEQLRLLEG
jgi:hypothetical protein